MTVCNSNMYVTEQYRTVVMCLRLNVLFYYCYKSAIYLSDGEVILRQALVIFSLQMVSELLVTVDNDISTSHD